jgi:hypothetical protein
MAKVVQSISEKRGKSQISSTFLLHRHGDHREIRDRGKVQQRIVEIQGVIRRRLVIIRAYSVKVCVCRWLWRRKRGYALKSAEYIALARIP